MLGWMLWRLTSKGYQVMNRHNIKRSWYLFPKPKKEEKPETPQALHYQGSQKEGQPLDPRAVSFIKKWYGQDWNNYHEMAAEEISSVVNRLDILLR